MSSLILPDVVGYNMELEQRLEGVGRARERAGWLRHFDAELKNLDPLLSLVKASDDAQPPLVAGYWHVKRQNFPSVDSYLPICGTDGEFMEPHMGVLETLKRQDLQKPGALDRYRKEQEARILEERRFQQRAKEDRVEEFATRLKAIDSPGVSFSDTPWSWRAGKRK